MHVDIDIRVAFSAIFTFLMIALCFCAVKGFRSNRKIGRAVGWLDLSLLPPMIGNIIIIGSSVEIRSLVGEYIFSLGMNGVPVSRNLRQYTLCWRQTLFRCWQTSFSVMLLTLNL